MRNITTICLQLKEHNQKATIDAVAKVLETNPNVLFSGKPKNNSLYSMVVSNDDKSKISKKKVEDEADANPIITDYKELEAWLEAPEHKSGVSDEFLFLLEKMAN